MVRVVCAKKKLIFGDGIADSHFFGLWLGGFGLVDMVLEGFFDV